MNLLTFTGNLGHDAEVRHTQSGTAVASFSVAMKAGYGDNQKTVWVRCNLWGKRAESKLVEYLVKGQAVAVSGEASTNEWVNNDGEAKFSLECNVNDITLMGGTGSGEKSTEQAAPVATQGAKTPAGDFDDDMPW